MRMRSGVPVFLVLCLISNNFAAKIDDLKIDELKKYLGQKVEATVENMLTSLKMAEADDAASRLDALEYTVMVLEEKNDDLKKQLAEKQNESEKLTEKSFSRLVLFGEEVCSQKTEQLRKTQIEDMESLKESLNKSYEDIHMNISKLQIFRDDAQLRLNEISATEPVDSETSKIKDEVAKVQIVQQLIQTKQSSIVKQLESHGSKLVSHDSMIEFSVLKTKEWTQNWAKLYAALKARSDSVDDKITSEKQENQEQSKYIAQLQIFRELVLARFKKIADDSSRVQMVEAKVDSVDAKVSKIRDSFQNEIIPALQSVFEDGVVEDTTAGITTESMATKTEYPTTTRVETTKMIETATISEETTTPIPTPEGWSTPGGVTPADEEVLETTKAETTKKTETTKNKNYATTRMPLTTKAETTTPMPTPEGWFTPGGVTPADKEVSETTKAEATKKTETTKNKKYATTRMASLEEMTEKGWSTPGGMTIEGDGSGFATLSKFSGPINADDDEEFLYSEEILTEPLSESTEEATEPKIKNKKLKNSVMSIIKSITG